jgi:hypothetical protein
MEKRWVKRNVDLELLSEALADFWAERGFKLRMERQAREYRICALPKYPHDVCEKVDVLITGDSNDFVVKLVSGSQSRLFVRFGSLTTIFGGGSFLLRGLKSEEMLEKLETEFWTYVETMIDYLGGSELKVSYKALRKKGSESN